MIDISILLPTRGRTEMLRRCLLSLADLADDATCIEMLLAFDNDDMASYQWFEQHVVPELNQRGINYTAMGFERLGYIRLNEYLNHLASRSQGHWLFFWGDDAIMESQGWDSRIKEVEDFRVLRIPAHNLHPYAIWPIVPRRWYEICGYISDHQLTDSWVSQIGYMMDIMQNIDVRATHDRFDLTGNNKDETYHNRPMLEGNPSDPRDFNHVTWRTRRYQDADLLSKIMVQHEQSVDWWQRVKANQQDPWEKMCSAEQDPNGQVARC